MDLEYYDCASIRLESAAAGRAGALSAGLNLHCSWPILADMRIKCLPAGFVIPAQPILASKPPSGTDWVHEIKHDGYRIIVRRDGPTLRLYSRNAYDWTARLAAIAAAAELIKAKSFTIDGEAVVLGPDGLSRFEELQRRTAAHAAILYAFDLIEHDGEDLRKRPFLDRKAALRRLLGGMKAGILLNEHIAEDGPTVFAMHAGSSPRALFRSGSTAPTSPVRAASGSRYAIPPASRCSGRGARIGIGDYRPSLFGFRAVATGASGGLPAARGREAP
jgi:bifunctional non-homologous end joining protein LigD